MSFSHFSPAAEILKALGINEDFVQSYSLRFSAEDVTTCLVEVVVCRDPLQAFEEQIKRYKVTLEPLEESADPEPHSLGDQPQNPTDLSTPPDSFSWGQMP